VRSQVDAVCQDCLLFLFDNASCRDGCPLIRNLVSSVAEHIARTANVEESAAIVRKNVKEVMEVLLLCLFLPLSTS